MLQSIKSYGPRINFLDKTLLALAFSGICFGQMGSQMGSGGGFGGPAVLGRGSGSGAGQRAGADVALRFYAGVTAVFDTGLAGFAVDPSGSLRSSSTTGVDGVAGIYGTKRLHRGQFGINYQGGYHQSNQKLYNGTDQSLTLFYSTQTTKRSQLSLNGSAGTTNRAVGVPMNGAFDSLVNTYSVPTNELFDNRFYYGGAGAQFILQKSARLSFGVTGNLFVTRRTGGILFGSNGLFSGANAAYRLSRRQTVTAGYQFFVFNFTRNFGDSYGHGVFGGYSIQVSPSLSLSIRGGATRLESLGLRTVSIDPVIAALIGRASTQEVYYGISTIPNGALTVNYKVSKRCSLTGFGSLAVTPGNGVINTSRNLSSGVNYAYSGFRVVSLGANAFYSRLSSVVGDHQTFSTINAALTASRKLAGNFHLVANAGTRKFLQSDTNAYNRLTYYGSFGVFWSPGELPLSIH